MKYLVDTNLISETAPLRSRPDDQLIDWLDTRRQSLHLSAVTIWELEGGCEALRLRGAVAKAAALQEWIDGIAVVLGQRIIHIDQKAAALGGRKLAQAQARGHDPGIGDALIAAQAELSDMIIVTANARDFLALGARFVDPRSP
jgi:hypothetical protein